MQFFATIDPLYVLSGFCVGVLVGMTGIGGGSLMTPALILIFGIHPATAVGTDLLFACLTKIVGTLVHGAARNVDWRLFGLLACGSAPAAIVSLLVLSVLNFGDSGGGHALSLALGCVLVFTASFLLGAPAIRARYAAAIGELPAQTRSMLTVLLGVVMGVVVSFTSVGAGAIGITVLLLLHPSMRTARIVGSDIAHAVPLTLVAGMGHWYLGSVNWHLLGTLLVGSLPGIIIGSYLTRRVPDAAVRIVLAIVLLVVGVRLIF